MDVQDFFDILYVLTLFACFVVLLLAGFVHWHIQEERGHIERLQRDRIEARLARIKILVDSRRGRRPEHVR